MFVGFAAFCVNVSRYERGKGQSGEEGLRGSDGGRKGMREGGAWGTQAGEGRMERDRWRILIIVRNKSGSDVYSHVKLF